MCDTILGISDGCFLSIQKIREELSILSVYFLLAAVTNYHMVNVLKQHKLINLTILEVGSPKNQHVNRAVFCLKALGENPSPCFLQVLEVTCVPGSSPSSKPAMQASSYQSQSSSMPLLAFISHLLVPLTFLLTSHKEIWDYIGPTKKIQGYHPISRFSI